MNVGINPYTCICLNTSVLGIYLLLKIVSRFKLQFNLRKKGIDIIYNIMSLYTFV